MKKYSLLFVYLLGTFLAMANSDDTTPYLTKTFNAANIKALYVRTAGGSINVTGQGGEAKVEVIIKPNNWNGRNTLDKEEIEDRLQDYELTVAMEGNTLVCKAKRKNNDDRWEWKRGLSISFRISVPSQISSDLLTSGGSIKLKNLSGKQEFTTSGGSINVEELKGDIKGRTSGGSIQLAHCHNQIDLTTSGGSITADDCSGDITLKTSGGSISLQQMQGQIEAHTSGGSIKGERIKGDLSAKTSGGGIRLTQMAGALKASTSAGGIDVTMTSLDKHLDLSTSAGGIRVQMPLNKGMDLDLRSTNRVDIARLENFSGSQKKDRVQGQVNGGGIAVNMRTTAGSISINE